MSPVRVSNWVEPYVQIGSVQQLIVSLVNQQAPTFTAPIADTDGLSTMTLSDALGDGPIVLAFFPAAFSSVCTAELCTFRDGLSTFNELSARIYGISTDLPYALAEFRTQFELGFPLISDTNGTIIEQYGVTTSFDHIGLQPVAQRAVFVLDETGRVVYEWIADNPGQQPEYNAVESAVATLIAEQ